MAATRALTIPDVYERFVKGKKVPEADWDYKIIPENLTALKEKYNIKIENDSIIPEDKELINNLFLYAGPEHPHQAQNPKEIKLNEM